MESAMRKRKSCSEEEESDMSTSSIQVKTRRLEDPNPCSDRVSTATPTPISGNKLASENVDAPEEVQCENEVTVEKPMGDRGERSHVEGEQAVVEESTMGSFMTERMLVAADEFKRSFLVNVENMRKQFIDKYNFDIVKDEPLEGPYEWVRIDQNDKP